MAKHVSELNDVYPFLGQKVATNDWKTEGKGTWGDTVRKKSNGSEYGTTLIKGLHVLNVYAEHNTLPDNMITLSKTLSVKGSSYKRLALAMCGRGEKEHDTGKSINTPLIGADAAATVCKQTGQAMAVDIMLKLEASLIQVQAEKNKADKARTSAEKRRATAIKRKAAKVSKTPPATKPANIPAKMPAKNAG